jgi:hypothetical protein
MTIEAPVRKFILYDCVCTPANVGAAFRLSAKKPASEVGAGFLIIFHCYASLRSA